MPQEIPADEETLLEYYVYEIRDPSAPPEKAVFYVGKGAGRRIEQHEIDADRLADTVGAAKTEKHQKILEIKARGETPIARVVGRFNTPEEAFAVEATLLHWVYGFPGGREGSALTNIQAGHNHRYIRPKGDLSQLPGLDVNQKAKARVYDGTFTRTALQANDRYSVYDSLIELRAFCIDCNPDWAQDLTDVDMSNPKDPSFYLRIQDVARIQVLLRGSRTRAPILNVRPVDGHAASKARFFALAARLFEAGKGGDVKMQKSSTPYFKISAIQGRPNLSQPDAVYEHIRTIWQLVAMYSI